MATVITLDEVQCCECGVYFGVEHSFNLLLQRMGPKKNFYCPNGCQMHYIKNDSPPTPPKPGKDLPVHEDPKVVNLIKK